MSPTHWRRFFVICSEVLGEGSQSAWASNTWCAWTTFSRLQEDVFYWSAGLPNREDIGVVGIHDGGVWGQPFNYTDLAHLIVPAQFSWERGRGPEFTNGFKKQNLGRLAMALESESIPHRLTRLVLEVKLY